MRKTILITTALLASTALAAAQGTGQSAPQTGAAPAPSVQRSAPAEKMDQRDPSRGAQSKPAETGGQAQKAGEANPAGQGCIRQQGHAEPRRHQADRQQGRCQQGGRGQVEGRHVEIRFG